MITKEEFLTYLKVEDAIWDLVSERLHKIQGSVWTIEVVEHFTNKEEDGIKNFIRIEVWDSYTQEQLDIKLIPIDYLFDPLWQEKGCHGEG